MCQIPGPRRDEQDVQNARGRQSGAGRPSTGGGDRPPPGDAVDNVAAWLAGDRLKNTETNGKRGGGPCQGPTYLGKAGRVGECGSAAIVRRRWWRLSLREPAVAPWEFVGSDFQIFTVISASSLVMSLYLPYFISIMLLCYGASRVTWRRRRNPVLGSFVLTAVLVHGAASLLCGESRGTFVAHPGLLV